MGFRPLPEEIAASLPADSAGSTTGNFCSHYRQVSQSLPADSAGYIRNLNRQIEPSEEEGHAGAREEATTTEHKVVRYIATVPGLEDVSTDDILAYVRDCQSNRRHPVSDFVLLREFQKFSSAYPRLRDPAWRKRVSAWFEQIPDEPDEAAADEPRPLYEDWTDHAPWEEPRDDD